MDCSCYSNDCNFNENFKNEENASNFIFAPSKDIPLVELIHVMMAGVRSFHIDFTIGTTEEHQKLLQKLDCSAKIFRHGSKFNFRITKICTIRGRIARTGRMKEDSAWNLRPGDQIVLTCNKKYQNCSTNLVCYVSNFRRLIPLLRQNDLIKIGSGIEIKVKKVALNEFVTCSVMLHDCLESFQELHVPNIIDESVDLTEEDFEDCEMATKHEFDFMVVPSIYGSEYYENLSKVIGKSHLKMIAMLDAEQLVTDQIKKQFYGVYLEAPLEYEILKSIRQSGKLVIVGVKRRQSCIKLLDLFHIADALMLNTSDSSETVLKVSSRLRQLSRHYGELQSNSFDNVETSNACLNAAMRMLKTPKSKALLVMTQKEEIIVKSSNQHSNRPIILLTKSQTLVKRAQLRKNVTSLLYLDCDHKLWKNQYREMLKIAVLYGRELRVLSPEDVIIACCNTDSDNGEINQIDVLKVEESDK